MDHTEILLLRAHCGNGLIGVEFSGCSARVGIAIGSAFANALATFPRGYCSGCAHCFAGSIESNAFAQADLSRDPTQIIF